VGQEVLWLISEDLAALAHAANVCQRRVVEQEKVPVAEKIISLSDSDASFIVKGGWNTVVGYRPQLARSGRGFVTALVLNWGSWVKRADPGKPEFTSTSASNIYKRLRDQIVSPGDQIQKEYKSMSE
jgi:hypothetical protein